jgi:hypothetical protein
VDTEGLVVKVKVHSVKVPDQGGLKLLPESVGSGVSCLRHLCLNAGYEGRAKRWAERRILGLSVEVVRKPQKSTLEKVARTFSSGQRNERNKARRSIRRSSCAGRHSGIASPMGGRRADLLLLKPEQADNQGLREVVRQR